MNPYPERLQALLGHLEDRYGLRDAVAARIALACIIETDSPGYRHPWIIIDTDYPNRDTDDTWFAWGGAGPEVRTLARVPTLRPHAGEVIINEWLQERSRGLPGVYVDTEWRRPAGAGRQSNLMDSRKSYSAFLSQCLRLKTMYPKNDRAIRSDEEREKDRIVLRRLAAATLEGEHRMLSHSMFAARAHQYAPPSYLYWCEVAQRLSPVQGDWDVIAGGIMRIVVADAYLTQNDPMNESSYDWRLAERLIRDLVPYQTRWILERASLERSKGLAAFALWRQSGEKFSRPFVEEIRRLCERGVLKTRDRYPGRGLIYHPWKYYTSHEDFSQIVDPSHPLFI